jgi:PleD family two-component response regulator
VTETIVLLPELVVAATIFESPERLVMTTATKKVLLVDHDVLLRTRLSQIFKERGYSVRSAPDGISAMADIWDDLSDILLADLNMPGMSGYVLLSAVHKYFPGILIVVMANVVIVIPPISSVTQICPRAVIVCL